MKILDFLTKACTERGSAVSNETVQILEGYAGEPVNEVQAFFDGYIVTDMHFVPGKSISRSGFIPPKYVGDLIWICNGQKYTLMKNVEDNCGVSEAPLSRSREIAGLFISHPEYHAASALEAFRRDYANGAFAQDSQPGEDD